MRRFKGFGVRRMSFEKGSSGGDDDGGPQCFPQFYSPARDSLHRRRSVDGPGREREVVQQQLPMRRRSVDDSRYAESADLHAVRKEWKNCANDSFSSSSDVQCSSRFSDGSAASGDINITVTNRDVSGASSGARVVVVAFDANAKESGVGASVLWAFRNGGMHRGDTVVLVGVADTVRGPLGFKVQVNDQTWLGANKMFLDEEMKSKYAIWSEQFRKRCADAGVTLVVEVRATARPEVVIVQESLSRNAGHVVLDKSLGNKRRRYYLDRLSCDVTRMRRSGGVDVMVRAPPPSPTSVLPPPPQQLPLPSPSPLPPPPALPGRNSFNSNLSRLVRLVEEKNHSHSTSRRRNAGSMSQAIDEDDLFCIDHDFLTRRVEMLLEPEPDLADHRRHDQCIVDEGYESDDLFSLAGGDGNSRRPSLAVFTMDASARNSLRSSLSRIAHVPPG